MARPLPDSGFAPVAYEQWAAAVAADLGPDALDRRLRAVTEDGIVLEALPRPGTAGPGAGVGRALAVLLAGARRARAGRGWLVRQRLDAATLTRDDLRDELAGGTDSVELDLARVEPLGIAARVGALAPSIWKAGAELALAGLQDPTPVLETLAAAPAPGAVALGVDPLGTWARRGAVGDPAHALAGLEAMRPWIGGGGPASLLRASGEPWHDAGATPAWTIAGVAASALDCVRWLASHGTDAGLVVRGLELVLPIGTDIFEGIASVRALRLVWSRVLEELGTDASTPPRVVVVFGRRGLARRDPWVNVLRETAAAFAGAVGGADVIQLPPFDERLRSDSPEARRLARNTSLVLREEAGLHRVTDPAGGSWHLDTLTGLLAERAWDRLVELERAGGMAAAIAAGLVERRLGEARLAREERVRTRARPLVGVSDFADAAERDPTVLRAVEPPNPRFGMRAESEVFERLRDVADGWARAHGGAPRLFLARLGPPRESSARAAFVRGAASAGGFEAVGPDALADAETAAREFGASGAGIAVLCGADARYDAEAAALATALRAAGARQVLVAGRPGEHAEALRAAGVGGWMHAGADIAALLARAQLAAQVHP